MPMRNTVRLWIGIIPALLIWRTGAFAQTTWTVHPFLGADFMTIQGCIDDPRVMGGDTCLVYPGVYFENLEISGKSLTLQSWGGPEITVIDGWGLGPVVTLDRTSVLEGFTVRNGSRGVAIHFGATIRDCLIKENDGDGIYISGGARIEGSRISDNGRNGIDAHTVGYVEIRNCYVSGNGWSGVPGYGAAGIDVFASNTHHIIENTIVTGNQIGVTAGSYGYCDEGHPCEVRITHCTITGNGLDVACSLDNGGAVVKNSIVWSAEPSDEPLGYFCPKYRFAYSLIQLHPILIYYGGEGNIYGNPRFVGPDDLHLSRSSPCIDRAVSWRVDEDYDGNPRPQGKGFDMGAYELSSHPSDLFPLFPKQGAKVLSPPNFTWGEFNGGEEDYDLYVLLLWLPIPIPGYWYTPLPVPVYQSPYFKCPEELWGSVPEGGWGFWMVVGFDTTTWASAPTDLQYFQKVDDCVVHFSDYELASAVWYAITPQTVEIMASDLQGLTYLDIHDREIWNLDGLEYAVDLLEIDLSNNHIRDVVDYLSPLAGLTNLTILNLGDSQSYPERNDMLNISPLVGLTELQRLDLSGNRISDIEPLVLNPGMDAGDTVNLDDNPLSERSCTVYIPELEGRGVDMLHGCP